jgi:hypothetical protein
MMINEDDNIILPTASSHKINMIQEGFDPVGHLCMGLHAGR